MYDINFRKNTIILGLLYDNSIWVIWQRCISKKSDDRGSPVLIYFWTHKNHQKNEERAGIKQNIGMKCEYYYNY